MTVRLAYDLGLKAPVARDVSPVCPLGGAFWFRPAALARIFEHGFAYADFPEEPVPIDGTLLHAFERVYPYVCQDAGYFPAYVLTDRAARTELGNLRDVLQTFAGVLSQEEQGFAYDAETAAYYLKNKFEESRLLRFLGSESFAARARRELKSRLSPKNK